MRTLFMRAVILVTWAGVLASESVTRRMQLVHITSDQGRCLDGSQAGYFIRHGKDPTNWVVYLEGSDWCMSIEECEKMLGSNQGTSKGWDPEEIEDVGGIVSAISFENPDFSSWNHVYVPSCDATSLMSDRQAPVPTTSGKMIYLEGRKILDSVVRDLVQNKGLKGQGRVILAGSGTGGLGVLVNADRIAAMIRQLVGVADKDIVGLVDAAFLPDLNDLQTSSSAATLFTKAHNLWQAVLPLGGCEGQEKDVGRCMQAGHVSKNVKTPLYVVQSTHDCAHVHFAAKHGLCSAHVCPKRDDGSFTPTDTWLRAVNTSLSAVMQHRSHGIFVLSCSTADRIVTRTSTAAYPGCERCVGWRLHYAVIGCQKINVKETFGDWYFSYPWNTSPRSKVKVEFLKVVDPSGIQGNPTCGGKLDTAAQGTCSVIQ